MVQLQSWQWLLQHHQRSVCKTTATAVCSVCLSRGRERRRGNAWWKKRRNVSTNQRKEHGKLPVLCRLPKRAAAVVHSEREKNMTIEKRKAWKNKQRQHKWKYCKVPALSSTWFQRTVCLYHREMSSHNTFTTTQLQNKTATLSDFRNNSAQIWFILLINLKPSKVKVRIKGNIYSSARKQFTASSLLLHQQRDTKAIFTVLRGPLLQSLNVH